MGSADAHGGLCGPRQVMRVARWTGCKRRCWRSTLVLTAARTGVPVKSSPRRGNRLAAAAHAVAIGVDKAKSSDLSIVRTNILQYLDLRPRALARLVTRRRDTTSQDARSRGLDGIALQSVR